MSDIVEVRDADDPRLADFRDLAVADRRPDRPGGRGLVIAEGVEVVRRLFASPYRPRALFGVASKIAALAPETSAPCYAGTAELMAQVVGFHLNRGVLATADRAPVLPVAGLITQATHVAVLEGINDHENLGALFRNAAGLGVDAVLLGPRCADPLYRRSVRVSMGHVLRVPFGALPRWPGDLHQLRAAGFVLAALTPSADAIPLSAAGLTGTGLTGTGLAGTGLVGAGLAGVGEFRVSPEHRVAWLLGAEGSGLSADALAAADLAVRIPMAPGVDSLNVATAAAIAFATVRSL